MKKKIHEIEQEPMDGFEAANKMRGLKPGDPYYNDSAAAAAAYQGMETAGWIISDPPYNEYGQVVMQPPEGEKYE